MSVLCYPELHHHADVPAFTRTSPPSSDDPSGVARDDRAARGCGERLPPSLQNGRRHGA